MRLEMPKTEDTMETTDLVKQIKRSFRLYMNGVVAASMRQKGLDYKINWGISQIELRSIAAPYAGNRALAEALWADTSVRECRLLATLIMPAREMGLSKAIEWARGIDNVELAEAAAFNLFQHMPAAAQLAIRMLAGGTFVRLAAYNLLCRLVRGGVAMAPAAFDALFASASVDMASLIADVGSIPSGRQMLHAIVGLLDSISAKGGNNAAKADHLLGAML